MPDIKQRSLRSWAAGVHGLELDPDLRQWLAGVVDGMIPAADDWPAATEAGVVDFIEDHVDSDALAGFDAAREAAAGREGADAVAYLGESSPDLFGLVLVYTYTGYYGAAPVIDAIRAKGSDFHGAPQPQGYEIPQPSPVPSEPRGSYIPTAQVSRVS
jgi:hypothetical protein